MSERFVLTVGREFCSGGAQIAKRVAEILRVPYYDKEIIDHAADVLELSSDEVSAHDERPVRHAELIGYQYGIGMYAADPTLVLPVGMKVAQAQFRLIRGFAEQGSCVIVGRCANFILQNDPAMLSVFLYASPTVRCARAEELYRLDANKARKLLRRTDKIRAAYYRNYTQMEWGDARSYHLFLDVGTLGVEAAAQTIVAAIQAKYPQ